MHTLPALSADALLALLSAEESAVTMSAVFTVVEGISETPGLLKDYVSSDLFGDCCPIASKLSGYGGEGLFIVEHMLYGISLVES